MNLLDVKIAMDDLIEHHDVKPNENVYVKGIHGGELIDGFDVVETNNFTGVFVLDSRGEPAVSSRVVKELERKIERYREALKNIYELAEYDEYDNTLEQIVLEIEKTLEDDDDE